MTDAPVLAPPASWYPDPQDPGLLRWWSGTAWTAFTHPALQATMPQPPKPPRRWIGRFGGWIIVAGSAGVWLWVFGISLLLSAIAQHPGDDGHTPTLSPFLLVTGAATVGLAILYTMAYKLRPEDELTAPRLVLTGLIGGFASALLAAPINSLIAIVTGGAGAELSPTAMLTAGLVEEAAKIAAVVLLSLRLPVKNARIGLFVGGAVGLGFSMLENIQYLLEAFAAGQDTGTGIVPFVVTTFARQITGPFLHPVFTALLGAAVFAAARNGRFRLTGRVVLAYLAVAAAHGAFNGYLWVMQTAPIPNVARGGLILLATPLVLAAIGAGWLIIVRRIRGTGRTGPAADPQHAQDPARLLRGAEERVLEATRPWGVRAVTSAGSWPAGPTVTFLLAVDAELDRDALRRNGPWLLEVARWALAVGRFPDEVIARADVVVFVGERERMLAS